MYKTNKLSRYKTDTNHYTTMVNKITIRTKWLGIILLLGMTVRAMFANSWNFPVHDLTELSHFLNLLLFYLILNKKIISFVFKVACGLQHWLKMFFLYGFRALNHNINHGFQTLLQKNTPYVKK